MKAIRILLIAAGILIVGFLMLGLFSPKKIEVRKSTKIDAPTSAIFPHLQYFDKMVKWHPWFNKDPNLLVSVKGQDGTVTAIRKWDSQMEDVGSGQETILEIERGAYLKTKVEIMTPKASEGINQFSLVDANGTTQVIWQFSYEVPYPFNAFLIFGKADMGHLERQFAQGLQGLKQLLENVERSKVNYLINKFDLAGGQYMIKRKEVKISEINTFAEEAMKEMQQDRESAGLLKAGFPLGLIYAWDETTDIVDYAYAMPVTSTEGLKDPVLVNIEPEANVSSIFVNDLYGNRKHAHSFLRKSLSSKGIIYPVIEIYQKGVLAEGSPDVSGTRLLYRTEQE